MRKKSLTKRSSRFRLFRLVVLAGLLLTITLIFLVSTLGTQRFGSLHKLVLEAIGPLQKTVAAGSSYVSGFKSEYLDILQDVLKIREENKRLIKQLQENEVILNKSREAMATNVSLRKLLEFKNSLDRPMVAATVTAAPLSLTSIISWSRSARRSLYPVCSSVPWV